MRTDDHQLVRGLTGFEFVYEPIVALFVQSAECTAGLVGIVEDDDLERNIGLRIEVIAGESLVDHLLRESVADRFRGGVEKFAHPFGLIESERRFGSAATFGGIAKFESGPAYMTVPFGVVPSTTPM